MSEIKKLKDNTNSILAYAAVADNYLIGASLVEKMQHDRVPFFITAHAIDTSRNIMIFGLSDEMFTTYTSEFTKQSLKLVPNIIWDSIRDFIEPDEYLNQFAAAMSQMKLTPLARSPLPSIFGNNVQKELDNMLAEYETYFEYDKVFGSPTLHNNATCRSFLIKYQGFKDNREYVVLAGMDYKGIEYYTTASPAAMFGALGSLFGRKKKEEKGSTQFGHGKPCDAIEWGAANKFCMIVPKEYEQEATRDFLEFVATFHMESGLRQQFYQLKAQRAQMMYQQSLQYQQMAQQSMINLQRNQQQLARTLAENSAAMSAGIMDSWNRKMASDSRISQARSEAIRGVNVYQNSYGQNVDVSVTADHVYQNNYGDVYGVSGNSLDNELLSKLNWTEIKK